MPKGLLNWSYKDVITFLKGKGFTFYGERKGSHEAWISLDGQAVVEVNITKKSYPPLTMLTMIRQSCIDRKEWKKWASK